MTDIAQLQVSFDNLAAELRQTQAQQARTPSGTPEWWALQKQIGDLSKRTLEAEKAYLEARIAAAGGTHQSFQNRLYFVQMELQSPFLRNVVP